MGLGRPIPLSIRNRNPGNIRPGREPWVGEVGANGGFCVFDQMSSGIRALCKNLIAYQKHDDGHGGVIDTVEEAISRWAPPADRNNTEAYIALVCSVLECNRDDRFSFRDPDFLFWMAQAIAIEEGGYDALEYITFDDFDAGVKAALS